MASLALNLLRPIYGITDGAKRGFGCFVPQKRTTQSASDLVKYTRSAAQASKERQEQSSCCESQVALWAQACSSVLLFREIALMKSKVQQARRRSHFLVIIEQMCVKAQTHQCCAVCVGGWVCLPAVLSLERTKSHIHIFSGVFSAVRRISPAAHLIPGKVPQSCSPSGWQLLPRKCLLRLVHSLHKTQSRKRK